MRVILTHRILAMAHPRVCHLIFLLVIYLFYCLSDLITSSSCRGSLYQGFPYLLERSLQCNLCQISPLFLLRTTHPSARGSINNDGVSFAFASLPSFFSHLMSSFLVVGFFALLSSRQVHTVITKADDSSTSIWHVHYEMVLTCQEPPSLPAELRNYSPVNDTVFQDDTVVFVMAKAYVSPGNVAGNILLEATVAQKTVSMFGHFSVLC
jgi:hypothetical protein